MTADDPVRRPFARPANRHDQPSTPTLVNRAKLGDIQAFEAIVTRYYARCMRFAHGMLRDPADADDVVQETFVRLYRALPRYEERQRFDSWLFRILGNCCRTANVLQQRRESIDARDESDAARRVPSTDRPDAAFDHEWGDEVRRALAEVPEYNREIFLLHYVEGFSYEEIERITGVRQSALKMRVKRASDFLRVRARGSAPWLSVATSRVRSSSARSSRLRELPRGGQRSCGAHRCRRRRGRARRTSRLTTTSSCPRYRERRLWPFALAAAAVVLMFGGAIVVKIARSNADDGANLTAANSAVVQVVEPWTECGRRDSGADTVRVRRPRATRRARWGLQQLGRACDAARAGTGQHALVRDRSDSTRPAHLRFPRRLGLDGRQPRARRAAIPISA